MAGLEERVSVPETHKKVQRFIELGSALGLQVSYEHWNGVATVTSMTGQTTKILGGIKMALTFLKGYEWYEISRESPSPHAWKDED